MISTIKQGPSAVTIRSYLLVTECIFTEYSSYLPVAMSSKMLSADEIVTRDRNIRTDTKIIPVVILSLSDKTDSVLGDMMKAALRLKTYDFYPNSWIGKILQEQLWKFLKGLIPYNLKRKR